MKTKCDLYPFIPEIHLFHDREKCLMFCERKTGVLPKLKNADAQTIDYGDGIIVLMEVRDDLLWENALLVHESYHVMRFHLENLGERHAGEEIGAYMIQCIAGSLMEAHARWRERHVGDEE